MRGCCIRLSLAGMLALTLGACQASTPEVAPIVDSGVPDLTAPVVCPEADPSVYIGSVSTSSTTSALVQAIRGKAVNADNVVARVGSVIQSLPGKVSPDGNFCVEVNLVANTQTVVELIPRTLHGCYGVARQTTLIHQYTGGSTPLPISSSTPTTQNILLGKTVDSPYAESAGSAQAVTDGRTDSFAIFSTYDVFATKAVWLRIDMGQVYSISQFHIDWDADASTEWATNYSIYTSVSGSPGDPTSTSSRDWNEAVQQLHANRGSQVVQPAGGSVSARWLALVLREDNTYIKDIYHLAEFGAYITPAQQAPIGNPQEDHCP